MAIGEILWDLLPTGPQFGGAPANFAWGAASLGQQATQVKLVSAVGMDRLGEQALDSLGDRSIDRSFVQRNQAATGTVDVHLDDRGQASYQFAEDSAWDHLAWNPELEQLVQTASAICFGTLAQRHPDSRATIARVLETAPPAAMKVCDLNLRAPHISKDVVLFSLQQAQLLKLNDEELEFLAELCDLAGAERELLQALAARYDLHGIALTRGSQGALLVEGQQIVECPAKSVPVVDTIGAGDSFTAAYLVGRLAGWPLTKIGDWASNVAAFVCTQAGATPELPARLRPSEFASAASQKADDER